MLPKHIRKRNRLPLHSYRGFRSYLVTLCTQCREKRFTSSDVVNSAVAALSVQSQKYWFAVHAYCFLPDHCHIILVATAADSHLVALVRGFKAGVAAAVRDRGFHDLWQKGFHDRILRSSEELAAATAYIFENPVRAGLTKTVYDWAFSGSFVFEWKRFADAGTHASRGV